MITRSDKETQVAGLHDRLGRANGAFLVDYSGMQVSDVTGLRKKLATVDAELKIYRNTLVKVALKQKESNWTPFEPQLKGTNALVFSYGDVAQVAKTVANFDDSLEVFKLKMGVVGKQSLAREGVIKLGSLPSLEILQAKFLGLLSQPMSKFVGVLNAVPSGFVRVLKSYVDKKQVSQ